MARLNTRQSLAPLTHEGARAKLLTPTQQLRRSVCSALLWEDECYEDGVEISDRVIDVANRVSVQELSELVGELRTKQKLRHMPLLMAAVLATRSEGRHLIQSTLDVCIQRADELTEFLAVYAKINEVSIAQLKPVLSAQVKKGLGKALRKFDAYQLAKYNRKGGVTLKDVIRLCHPKPSTEEQSALWKRVLDDSLDSPDTWEVALSGGKDKNETFTRLLRQGKLGYLALLRNLRNMMEVGVDVDLVRTAIQARKGARVVLPFRYVAAARACPQLEEYIEEALLTAIAELDPLPKKTIVLVDVSGSMVCKLSKRSDMTRLDAAATLASVIKGERRVFSFSNELAEIPPRLGMSGVDAIVNSQPHGGTYLGRAVQYCNSLEHDRLVVLTDEQSHDRVPDPVAKYAYMINVASYRNGVGYGRWTHLDGFSENVLRFIHEWEALEQDIEHTNAGNE